MFSAHVLFDDKIPDRQSEILEIDELAVKFALQFELLSKSTFTMI